MKHSILITALIATGIAGCGSGAAPPEPTYPVSGVVTFKGQPVVGADITFFNAEKKRSAFGRSNNNGEYKLTTFSSNDGAVDGKSAVIIMKYAPPPADIVQPDVDSEDYQPPGIGQDTMPAKPKSDIPERYADQATSGLIAVVSAETENVINFDLEE
ncbi:MAG: hypothetical protein RIK87_00535 [Fuerstiella sp.]